MSLLGHFVHFVTHFVCAVRISKCESSEYEHRAVLNDHVQSYTVCGQKKLKNLIWAWSLVNGTNSFSSVARHDRRGTNCPQVLRGYLKRGANPYKYRPSLPRLPACLPMARSVEDPPALRAG